MRKPNSMRHLDDTIRRKASGSVDEYLRLRTLMATAIVAQMLPDGVVKGGSAMKMRFGDAATRFTTDLDTATVLGADEYAERLSESLASGWEGFTGRVVPREPAHPEGVPEAYVMRPFDVKLSYMGKAWCTVPLEVGGNEIGDADTSDLSTLNDAAALFAELGFPAPGRVSLMRLPYQVAQKLHGVTGGGDRVRDLVDLQLMFANSGINLAETQAICMRLFAYRKAQDWPPTVEKREGWNALYAEQAAGLPVLQNVDEAIAWTNDLIAHIDAAGR